MRSGRGGLRGKIMLSSKLTAHFRRQQKTILGIENEWRHRAFEAESELVQAEFRKAANLLSDARYALDRAMQTLKDPPVDPA